jgi:hypothetical protein
VPSELEVIERGKISARAQSWPVLPPTETLQVPFDTKYGITSHLLLPVCEGCRYSDCFWDSDHVFLPKTYRGPRWNFA